MRIVGLTGGFGTGKSFVASLFRRLGARVVDADKLGHKALKKGSTAYKRVAAVFGKKILNPDLSINRKALAGIVFADRKKMAKLNRIVHPGIIKDIVSSAGRCKKSEVLIVDAPLICEANITGLMNVLIVVKASKSNQIERSLKKFNMDEKDARKRIACQMPLNKKVRMADYTVDNDGTKEETKKQVRNIWRQLKPFGTSAGSVPSRAVRQAHDASNGAEQGRGTKSRDGKSSGLYPEPCRPSVNSGLTLSLSKGRKIKKGA